jgi:sterol desaturase/sphingolipid hydroxylase (fatty acid hydroxylase superfamily)
MKLLSLEHGRTAYVVDFVFYASAVLSLAVFLLCMPPPGTALQACAVVLLGLCSWSLIEYIFHRFILHGLQPFRRLHALHHARPRALICTPTVLSAGLIFVLVFLPACYWSDLWRASQLTLGVLLGYLAYSVMHHAMHHWRSPMPWFMRRKRWHALHHHADEPVCMGVTSTVWDYVFRSLPGGLHR